MEMNFIMLTAISFMITIVNNILLIPVLKRIRVGQTVRNNGPISHLKKMGIPTMGGITFLIPVILISIFSFRYYPQMLVLILSTFGFGMIGFIDDYIKVIKKRKDGLNPKQKSFMQIAIGVIIAFFVIANNFIDNILYFPWGTMYLPDPILIIYIIFILYLTSNAVNLTDGLDGLLSSITIIVLMGFIFLALGDSKLDYIRIFCMLLMGGCLGFLLFNRYPASIIMGDFGSLALGGAVGTLIILLKSPIILFSFGIIYIIEALSVVLQVTAYKITGKRVFKMAPIHHHFELMGWKETKIVKIFSFITIIFCVIGIFVYDIMIGQ